MATLFNRLFGGRTTPAEAKAAPLLMTLRELGAPVFFLAIKPSPARWFIQRRVVMANDMIRLELLNRPGDLYIDIHTPMIDRATGHPDPRLYIEDGLHLSQEGYKLWAEVVRPSLKPFAEEPPSWY